MEILNQETLAWMRAGEVAGVELPGPITEALANLEKVDAERAGLPEPTRPPTPEQLVASGTPLDKATAEAEKAARQAETQAEKHRIAIAARDQCRRTLNRAVIAHRDELIVGIRPLVTSIVDEARPHAEALAEFHPDYAPAALMRKASARQLTAFQKADELEARFGALLAAWRSSWKAHTKRPGSFDVREVPQERWYWRNPGAVADDALNGTRLNKYGSYVRIQPTVLGIASSPAEAEFVLATVDELQEIHGAAHRARVEEAAWQSRPGGRGMAV